MTWSQGVESANKYWRILGTVSTVTIMTGGALYAAGRNTEKFSTDQEKIKVQLVGVKTAVQSITEKDLPSIVESIKSNTVLNEDLKREASVYTNNSKIDKEELKLVKIDVQMIKEQLSAMKTQQKSDADWIKNALVRIEAKQ
jgi:hypothetical protein